MQAASSSSKRNTPDLQRAAVAEHAHQSSRAASPSARAWHVRARWLSPWLIVSILGACATAQLPPSQTVPRPYGEQDRAGAGQGAVLIDVTNAATEVGAARSSERCSTPCVLKLAEGPQRLQFRYSMDGRSRTDEVPVLVSSEPQVYRRAVDEVRIHSRAGRIIGLTLLGLANASMLTALGLLAAHDSDRMNATRRGLGIGAVAGFGVSIALGAWSVRKSEGAGVLFPWRGSAQSTLEAK